MTEPIENPSLSPEEQAPKKPARRKSPLSPATPRKPRVAKTATAQEPDTEKAAPKATRKTGATRKKAVKQEPEAKMPEPPVSAPVEPVAQMELLVEPVTEVQQPVAQAPAEPLASPAPQESRSGRGRGPRERTRTRKPQPQGLAPIVPQPPSHAGAVIEEWSPGSRNVTPSPSRPESVIQPEPASAATPAPATAPAASAKPEELVIRRREIPHQLSREERIAAARQQFQAAEPSMQSQEPAATEQPLSPVPLPEQPRQEPVYAEGLVEVSGKGFGFLRDPKRGYAQHPADVFVTPEVCRRYNLRDGMWIRGEIRRGNRGPQLFRLTEIEGEDPSKALNTPLFDELTTINPNKFIKMETEPDRFTTRVIDLMAPIGRGQRGLIVAPPRTGKTTFLQHIAEAVVKNHPDMKLIILLVDERPEEVTEIRRAVPEAELMASSNDQDIKCHTRIAQLAIERARRLVELGKHVFILLDSITRVGRAFNNAMAGGGRTMSGGVDARALDIPRRLFASARNTEEAGSLTIIATALIETGSRMDELIFQEFKGTGNQELVLDRKISDLRIYPAVDIFMSGTRREELLLPEADLHKINIIRRGLSGHKPAEAIERLLFFLKKFPTNTQMLREIPG